MELTERLIKIAKDHYHIDSKGNKTSPSDHKGKGEEAPHDHKLKEGGRTDMKESGKNHKHKEPSGEMTSESKKTASPMLGPVLEGVMSGMSSGKRTAGTVANMMSAQGSKTKNEELAKSIATVTAPAGGIGAVLLGIKKKDEIARVVNRISKGDPMVNAALYTAGVFAGITGGSNLAGAATGALTSFRKSKTTKNMQAKTAMVRGFMKKAKIPAVTPDDIRLLRRYTEHVADEENRKLPYLSDKDFKSRLKDRLAHEHFEIKSDLERQDRPIDSPFKAKLKSTALGTGIGAMGGMYASWLGDMVGPKAQMASFAIPTLLGAGLGYASNRNYTEKGEASRRKELKKKLKKQMRDFPKRKKEIMKDLAHHITYMDGEAIEGSEE